MAKPINLTPPPGLTMAVLRGASSAQLTAPVMLTDFMGVAVYSLFTLRIRRHATDDTPEYRAELVYQVLPETVVLSAIVVEPTQLSVDEVVDALRRLRPFDWWKRYALTGIATLIAQETFDPTGPYAEPEDDVEKEVRSAALQTASMPLARRANRITKDHLVEVAKVYTEAWNSGLPPTDAVRAHWKTSYSTAARWVGRARKTEPPLLGPPTGPHGGTWEAQS